MSASLVGSEMCIRDSCLAHGRGCAGGSGAELSEQPLTHRGHPLVHLRDACLLYTSDAADDM
eukprot:11531022-Alexandrium_andersonii.AAC.1